MHQPDNYACPFCRIIDQQKEVANKEVVYEDDKVIVLIALHHKKGNEGNLLVVPKDHIENLYELPLELATPIQAATQIAARGLKLALGCDGVTIRQNNEPAGGQEVWHYHVHVIPRYSDDNFYKGSLEIAPDDERFAIAEKIRQAVAV